MYVVNSLSAEYYIFFFDFFKVAADIFFEQFPPDNLVPPNGQGNVSVCCDFFLVAFERPPAVKAVNEQLMVITQSFSIILLPQEAHQCIRLAVKSAHRIMIIYSKHFTRIQSHQFL